MKHVISLATVTAVLLLGGCGGSDDGGGGANSAVTGGDFVAEVRTTLGQEADAEPAAVDGGNAIDDSAEPETL